MPLTVALDLFGDCFLKFVISDGIDPRTVVHYGRTIPAPLRTALEFRDRCCVVPGCGRTFGLEFDHIVEFAKGGPASLQNLCRLCGFHHHLKTHKGYRIRGGPGRWEWLPPHERPADEFESSVAVRSNAAATPAGKSTQPTSPVQLTEPAVGPSVDRLF